MTLLSEKARLWPGHRASMVATAFVVTALAGCSSAEDKVYEAYKCGRVAAMAGQIGKARAAAANVEVHLKELKTSGSQLDLRLMTRFTDDLELHRLSPLGQGKKLVETFESSTCQKLYE
jgi:hypothetical protein